MGHEPAEPLRQEPPHPAELAAGREPRFCKRDRSTRSQPLPTTLNFWDTEYELAPPNAVTTLATAFVTSPDSVRDTGRQRSLPDSTVTRDFRSPVLLRSSTHLHTSQSAWDVATEPDLLEVVVLGASVSAGCGARADGRCLVANSWVRLLQDRLHALLQWTRWTVRLQVYAKNAVESDYFRLCLSSKLRNTTALVLIELESNLGTQPDQGLRFLLEDIRATVGSRAVVGFIGWPGGAHLQKRVAGTRSRLLSWLEHHHVDFVQVLGWLRQIPGAGLDCTPLLRHGSACTAARGASTNASTLGSCSAAFARPSQEMAGTCSIVHGDVVHPNPIGHALMAEQAARWIVQRLSDRSCDSLADTAESSTKSGDARAARTGEWCYDRLDRLATAGTGAFRLVNDGIAKGVLKLGLASVAVNDAVRLGPLLTDVRCGLAIASLGYLRSWRADMGAFRIDCSGCRCYKIPGMWARDAYPFPLVQSSSRRLTTRGSPCNENVCDLTNASVTLQTRFYLFKTDEPCHIRLTHVTFPPELPLPASRIRIDSLGLKLVGCPDLCHVIAGTYRNMHRLMRGSVHDPAGGPASTRMVRAGLATCERGHRQGLAGYHFAYCTNQSRVSSTAKLAERVGCGVL